MIHYIIGKISYIGNKFIIFDSNFIGYKIKILENHQFEKQKTMRLYTHKINKIDPKNNIIEEIYGFEHLIQKTLFVDLLSINGIGTTIASNVLSNYDPKEIIDYITNNDINKLKEIKGLNEKKALLITANLKYKYQNSWYLENKTNFNKDANDLTYALTELGYSKEDIKVAMDFYGQNKTMPLNELISNSIKLIANGKINHA